MISSIILKYPQHNMCNYLKHPTERTFKTCTTKRPCAPSTSVPTANASLNCRWSDSAWPASPWSPDVHPQERHPRSGLTTYERDCVHLHERVEAARRKAASLPAGMICQLLPAASTPEFLLWKPPIPSHILGPTTLREAPLLLPQKNGTMDCISSFVGDIRGSHYFEHIGNNI